MPAGAADGGAGGNAADAPASASPAPVYGGGDGDLGGWSEVIRECLGDSLGQSLSVRQIPAAAGAGPGRQLCP
eukprot:10019679-Alexandrium_andersonii.AAC.1